jgi:hypothetical protein
VAVIPVSLLAQVAFALDLDGDGVDDAVDGCPALADPAQADADLDGFGDVCDVCDGRGAGFSAIEGPWLVRTAAVDDVVAHDLDGDGDLDAVGVRRAAERLEVYTNLGGGRFDPANSQLAGDDPLYRTAALDVDGDGDLDLVYATTDQLRWSQNVGGTFAVDLRLAQAPGVADLVTADVDGDGDPDLVTTTATEVVAFLKVGGLFVRQAPVAAVVARLEVADVDGDGDADDVLAVDSSGAWTWLTAAPQGVAALPGSGFAGAWDVDGDGLVDLVFTDATGVWAALATAPGAFAAPTAVWSDPTLHPTSARPLDVDGVPPADLVVGDGGRTVVLQAEVTGGYVGWELVGGIRGLATGDLDGGRARRRRAGDPGRDRRPVDAGARLRRRGPGRRRPARRRGAGDLGLRPGLARVRRRRPPRRRRGGGGHEPGPRRHRRGWVRRRRGPVPDRRVRRGQRRRLGVRRLRRVRRRRRDR